MIFKYIINYLFGFINITVEGFFIERLINNCINNKITLWGINRKNSTLLSANVSIENFKKLRILAKKAKCRIKINKKIGLPILLHRYRKRKMLFIIIIPIIVCIIITSRYIWNIEITGVDETLKEEIISQLNEEGLTVGCLKRKIKNKDIINSIRLKRDDISWMAIDIKGTNAIISIVKATPKPNIINEDEYCNIVANMTGKITKITSDDGTSQVKVGDIVEKGTVLISGTMEGKYTDLRYVHAKGSVEAKVWYTNKVESSYIKENIEETGQIEEKYSINFNKFKINFNKSDTKFKNYDTICDIKKIKIFSNFYLPIEICKTTYVEKNTSIINYSKEDLKNMLISELEEKFASDGIDKMNVVNKVLNFYEKDDKLELEMTYEVITDIGTEEKIIF